MTTVSAPGACPDDNAPLLSSALFLRLGAFATAIVGMTVAAAIAGNMYGERLALGGHTASLASHDVFIGQDHLKLPGNVIRFEEQRRTGFANRVDLYATWPGMDGYNDARRVAFNGLSHPGSLLFLQISQSTMSRDMSGRVEPIYRHLFEGAPIPGSNGLLLHRLKKGSGYGQETFLTAKTDDGKDYAVRCMIPAEPTASTSADCQRDIHAGKDLVVLYRFSSQLLPQWQAIDQAVGDFVRARLVP